MDEAERLLNLIEKRFSVDWGFNTVGGHQSSHFIKTGKGIVIAPDKWLMFKEKQLSRKGK